MSQATISFTAPVNGGSPITSYSASCTPGPIAAVSSASPILVTNLSNGTAYTCSVTATNSFGSSVPSSPASVMPRAVPGVPTLNTAEAGNSKVVITFTAPASNGGVAITGYIASCGAIGISGATSPITVIGLANSMAYSCSVAATNAAGTGLSSAAVSRTPRGPVIVPGTYLLDD